MSEAQQPTVVQSPEGVERTPTGEIVDQTGKTEATTSTTPEPVKTEAETDTTKTTEPGKTEPAKGDKSLLNDKDAAGAPEKYADFKVPDGYELDKAVAEKISPMFKEMNLSQDQAQKLVDFYVAETKESQERPFKAYTDLRKEWRDSVASGPLGDKLSDVKVTVSRVIDSLPADVAKGFREAMDLTGAGDNPFFIQAIYAWAQKLAPGTHVPAGGVSKFANAVDGKPRSAGSALYPNLP